MNHRNLGIIHIIRVTHVNDTKNLLYSHVEVTILQSLTFLLKNHLI